MGDVAGPREGREERGDVPTWLGSDQQPASGGGARRAASLRQAGNWMGAWEGVPSALPV